MEETRKKIGLIDLFKNIFLNDNTEESSSSINIDEITGKDCAKAKVTLEEFNLLKKSLSKINNLTSNFFSNKKVKKDPVIEKYGEPESGNRIYDQGQKIAGIEESRKKEGIEKEQ